MDGQQAAGSAPALPLCPFCLFPLGLPAHLVRAVSTVVIAVALPASGDAATVGAGELAFGAGARGWGRTGKRGPREGGCGSPSPALARGTLQCPRPIPVTLKATVVWNSDQDAWVHWGRSLGCSSWGPVGHGQCSHLPHCGRIHSRGHRSLTCPQDTVGHRAVGGGAGEGVDHEDKHQGWGRGQQRMMGSEAQHGGRRALGQRQGCGGSTGGSETPTSAGPRGQCENGEKREMR